MTFSLSQSTSQTDSKTIKLMNIPESASDFNQWLHAMKMVARLPGGMPPEFRRKLWLALSDRYIVQSRKIDWKKEEIKCLSDQYKADDEELGIQIVKDLHRTGSSLCSGPNGTINQGKLKRVLLGYARFNPEVGYCQGFNILGALILQVMDKIEADSIKVMIYLIEGIIPPGYFCGSLSGLQIDMSVFIELLSARLPKLARHLKRLQGPSEDEPPLINMFNMQWFLTVFCTCLPINSVLRIWDLILIEGSGIFLRTALSIWGLLEKKILTTRTADDFYCSMGELSAQLLNGNLIDSNGLVQKVVELGQIPDLQKLRDKHRYNITPLRDKKGIKLFYSDDEGESDDESQLAVANKPRPTLKNLVENKQSIALDITLLKKQYDKLRERHRQAHIILTAACSKPNTQSNSSLQMNQLLMGKSAIVSNKGRRIGPPKGAVPPRINKPVKSTKSVKPVKLKSTDSFSREDEQRRRNSIKWKDIKEERRASMVDQKSSKKSEPCIKRSSSQSSGLNLDSISEQSSSKRKSESSSYSDETDSDSSSTSTSLCDDDITGGISSLENSPRKKRSTVEAIKSPSMTELEKYESIRKYVENLQFDYEKGITFPEESMVSGTVGCDVKPELPVNVTVTIPEIEYAAAPTDNVVATINMTKSFPSSLNLLQFDPENIVSTSQLSPIPDISQYISLSTISPLMTPSFIDDTTCSMNRSISSSNQLDMFSSSSSVELNKETPFLVSDEGVTNEFFERINITERPKHLNLSDFNASNVHQLEIRSPEAPTHTELPEKNIIQTNMEKGEPLPENHTPPVEELIPKFDFEVSDRTRYLREKSCSMDTPNHPIEDLTTRSSSDSKVSNNLDKNKRISRIIEENTAMLDRLKKAFNSDATDENLDISIEEIIHASDTLTNIISATDYADPVLDLTTHEVVAPDTSCMYQFETNTVSSSLSPTITQNFERSNVIVDFDIELKFENEITVSELQEISTQSRTVLAKCGKPDTHDNNELQNENETRIKDAMVVSLTFVTGKESEDKLDTIESLKESSNKKLLESPTIDKECDEGVGTKNKADVENTDDIKTWIKSPKSPTQKKTILKVSTFSNTIDEAGADKIIVRDWKKRPKSPSEKILLMKTSIFSTAINQDVTEDKQDGLEALTVCRAFEQDKGFNEGSVNHTINLIQPPIMAVEEHESLSFPPRVVVGFSTEAEIIEDRKSYLDDLFPATFHLNLESNHKKEIKSFETEKDNLTLSIIKTLLPDVKSDSAFNAPVKKPISLSTAFELELRRKSMEPKIEKEDLATQQLSKSVGHLSPTKRPALESETKDRTPSITRSYINELFPTTPSKLNRLSEFDTNVENMSKNTDFRSKSQSKPSKGNDLLEEPIRKRSPDSSSKQREGNRTPSNTPSPTYLHSPKELTSHQSNNPEKPASDITATINSIETTIKSINMLCKRNDDEKILARLDKIINEKPRGYDENRVTKSTPKILIDNEQTGDDFSSYSAYRTSRNNQRCISPRRRKDEDKEEYVSRVRRSDGSCFDADTSTSRYSFPDPVSSDGIKFSESRSTSIAPTTLPPLGSSPFSDKLEIRHTTFTSTFYDRFLSHKQEKSARSDKSPLSPTMPLQITRSYLDSLRATPTVSTASSRIIKSAENSPSRKKPTSTVKFADVYDDDTLYSTKLSTSNYSHVKSCENIPTHLRGTSRLDEFSRSEKYIDFKTDRTNMWN